MFNKKTQSERPGLNEAIELVLDELKTHDPDSKEYALILTQLERLYALQSPKKDNPVSKDGLVAVIGNLAGIGMILGFERFNVITSKALGFVIKSKV